MLRENVGGKCDKFLRGIRESHSPKSIHSPVATPREREDSPLKRDIRGSALVDNKSDQQSSVLEEEAEEGGQKDTRGNTREGIRPPGEGTSVERLPSNKSNRALDDRRFPSTEKDAKKNILLNDRPLLSRKNDASIGLMRLAGNATREKAKLKSILEERSFLPKKEGTLEVLPVGKTDIPQPADPLCSSTSIAEDRAKAAGSNRPTDRLSYGSAHRRRFSSENSPLGKRTWRDRKLKRSPPPEGEKEEDRPGSAGPDNGGSTDKRDSRCAVSRRHAGPRRQLIVKPAEEQITEKKNAQQLVKDSTGSVSECLLDRTLPTERLTAEGTLKPTIAANDHIERNPARFIETHPAVVVCEETSLADYSPGSTRDSSAGQPKCCSREKASGDCAHPLLIRPKDRMKLKMIRIRDKFVLALSAFAILFTLLLVMDLQMDLGYSGHHLVASHARVKLGDRPDTVYNNFRRRFLQRMNGSREQADATPGVVEKSSRASTTPARKHADEFPDLVDLVVNGYGVNVDEGVARISGEDHEYNPTIGELRKVAPR